MSKKLRKYEFVWTPISTKFSEEKQVLSARDYCDTLFDSLELILLDWFGAESEEVLRLLYRRIFRVYAHIYHSHALSKNVTYYSKVRIQSFKRKADN